MISPSVELHLHLDGGIFLHSTAYELLRAKNLTLPGNGSYEAFQEAFNPISPAKLPYLVLFTLIPSSVEGDLEAIERLGYEFCQIQAAQDIIYSEVRYTPHTFLVAPKFEASGSVTPRSIVEAMNRGLERGQKDFGITVRTILCCLLGKPELSHEILDLVVEFRHSRQVIGIDICSDTRETNLTVFMDESGTFEKENLEVFRKAAQLGIRRAVHAGGSGPASYVMRALEEMKAERIVAGYRTPEDERIFQYCKDKDIHFETTPDSESLNDILRFARDGVSFSVSTADPTIDNTTLQDKYRMLAKRGVSIAQLQKTNIDAMKNSFAEREVKEAVLRRLQDAYGMEASSTSASHSTSPSYPVVIVGFFIFLAIALISARKLKVKLQ